MSDYFNDSKLKVIGLITAATVAVGALGGIAGVAFDPDPVEGNVVQPGTGGQSLVPTQVEGGGPGASAASRSLPLVPRAFGTTAPSPVGTVSPGAPAPSSSSAPSAPAPSGGGGSSVTLSSTGALVFVPDGWNVAYSDESQMAMNDGTGNFAFAFSFAADPSTAAGDVITANLDGLLPPDNYTQLQTSDLVPLEPFGSVVSLSGMEYAALWVDNQGSASIHGLVYTAVRQDGTVLGILVEHVPGEEFEDAMEAVVPILDNTYGRFAGVS